MYVSALLKSTVVQEIYSDHELKSHVESFKFIDGEISSSLEITPLRDYSLVSQVMDYSGDWSIQSSFENPNRGDISFETSYNRAKTTVDFDFSSSFNLATFLSYSLEARLIYNYAVDHDIETSYKKILLNDFELKSHSRKKSFYNFSLTSSISFEHNIYSLTQFTMSSSFLMRRSVRFWENASFLDLIYVHSSLEIVPTVVNAATYPIGSQSIQITNEIGYYRSSLATVSLVRVLDLFGISKRVAQGRNLTTKSFEDVRFDYGELTYETPRLYSFTSNFMEMVITREIHEQYFVDADHFGLDVHIKRFDIPRITAIPMIATAYDNLNKELIDSRFYEIMYSLYQFKTDDLFKIDSAYVNFTVDRRPSRLAVTKSSYSTAIKGYTEGMAILIMTSDTHWYGIHFLSTTSKRAYLLESKYLSFFLMDKIEADNLAYYASTKIFYDGRTSLGNTDFFYKYVGIHDEHFEDIIRKSEVSVSARKVLIEENFKTIGILLDDQLIVEDGFEYGLDIGRLNTNVLYSREIDFEYAVELALVDLDHIVSSSIVFDIQMFAIITDLNQIIFDLSIPSLTPVLSGISSEGSFKYKDKEDLSGYITDAQEIYVNIFYTTENTIYYFLGEKEAV